MRRVAEIIHIVEPERQEFLSRVQQLSVEEAKVLWLCGVRKQQYFQLNDLFFMTFEYEGTDFQADMGKMAAYLDSKGHLVKLRRKDVPVEERETTNWWAPVKRIAELLTGEPDFGKDAATDQEDYMAMLDGCMGETDNHSDISYDEDDWSESMHI